MLYDLPHLLYKRLLRIFIHQSGKDCQALNMKLLIVLGLFPLFSASPFNSFHPSVYQGNNYNLDLSQVRNMAQILIADLRALNADPNSAKIISEIFEKTNKHCLRDMEDAILAIQEGTQLLDNASGDIQNMVAKVESMVGVKDEAQIVRHVASIMKSLQPLLTKLAPQNPASRVCKSSTENTFDYLHNLAVLLEEFSENPQLAVNTETQRMLVYSGSVLAGVTGFLQDLDSNTREFKNACTGDRFSGMRAINALGKIILKLGDMVSTLGGLKTGEEIRKGKKVAERIAVS